MASRMPTRSDDPAFAGWYRQLRLESLYLGEQHQDRPPHRPPFGISGRCKLLGPVAKLPLLVVIHSRILAHRRTRLPASARRWDALSRRRDADHPPGGHGYELTVRARRHRRCGDRTRCTSIWWRWGGWAATPRRYVLGSGDRAAPRNNTGSRSCNRGL